MAREISVKALAGAIAEKEDAYAVLQAETHANSVSPKTIARAERAKARLDQLMTELSMEAKDEAQRRYPKNSKKRK